MKAAEIKAVVPMERCLGFYGREIQDPNKNFQCLHPENHRNGDSHFSTNIFNGRLTCHSQGCFKNADIFEVVGTMEGLQSFQDQKARIEEMFGLDRSKANQKKRIVRTYDYVDQEGQLLFQTVRYEPKDFRQRRPDGTGDWIWNLKDTRLVLFRLREVMAAQNVLIVEGEKDVLTAYDLGLPEDWAATTSPIGAKKWKPQYSDFLKGKAVTIIPDRDAVGQAHQKQIAESLAGIGVKVNTLTLGNAHDLSDWVEAGGTSEEFCALLESAKVWEDTQGPEVNEPQGGPRVESPGETITRLAALSSLEYGQQRAGASKQLGVPLMFLDQAVTEARAANGTNKKPGQGSEITFDEIFPSEEPVDGAVLVQSLTAIIKRFMILPLGAALTIALWILRTFIFDSFGINPILSIRSPVMGCGKTTLINLIMMFVLKALATSNATPASVFRLIEKYHPTLLMDEMDSFKDSHEGFRGILNSCHNKRTAKVIRNVGDDHEPREFSTWTPVVLASIGKTYDTVDDRSLRIDLQKKAKDEGAEDFPQQGDDYDALEAETTIIRSQCLRWTHDNLDAIVNARVQKLEGLSSRANDNWYSLLAVASIVGAKCLEDAVTAAKAISSLGTEDPTAKTQLLIDIQELFKSRKADKLSSKDICESLAEMDERPWATWRKGKPISTNQLARLLKDFGVTSQTIRPKVEPTIKGYCKDHFEAAWGRYCVSPLENGDLKRHNVTNPMDKGQTTDFQNVTNPPCDVSENGTLANAGAGCDGVTDENPESRGKGTLLVEEEVIDLVNYTP